MANLPPILHRQTRVVARLLLDHGGATAVMLAIALSGIIGFAGLIAHRTLGEDSPRYFEYARDIEASGRYLLSIIEDLLDMNRIPAKPSKA